MKYLKQLFFSTLAIIVVACGGGSDPTGGGSDPASVAENNNDTPEDTINPVTPGIYDVNYGQFYGIYTFLEDGRFFGLHYISGPGGDTLINNPVLNNSILAGHPRGHLSELNIVGNPAHIAWANFVDDATMIGVQEPAPTLGRTFTNNNLDVQIKGSFGVFNATTTGQKHWVSGALLSETVELDEILFNNPIPIVSGMTISGILRTVGVNEPQENIQVTLDSAGVFTVSSNSCDYTGTLDLIGTSAIYDATATVSGNACTMASSLDGIMMPIDVIEFEENNLTVVWALMLNSNDEQQTAVFLFQDNLRVEP